MLSVPRNMNVFQIPHHQLRTTAKHAAPPPNVLTGFGMLFILQGVGQMVGTLTGQVTLNRPELGVLVADLLTIPTWIIGGILLWRQAIF